MPFHLFNGQSICDTGRKLFVNSREKTAEKFIFMAEHCDVLLSGFNQICFGLHMEVRGHTTYTTNFYFRAALFILEV